MSPNSTLAALRAQVAALVEEESTLLTKAFDLKRAGDGRGVDGLFAQIQVAQIERNRLTKQIGSVLGAQRMHVAAEVWKPGLYDYREKLDGVAVRVQVVSGPLGLQVLAPAQKQSVSIKTLKGTFDGPLGTS